MTSVLNGTYSAHFLYKLVVRMGLLINTFLFLQF